MTLAVLRARQPSLPSEDPNVPIKPRPRIAEGKSKREGICPALKTDDTTTAQQRGNARRPGSGSHEILFPSRWLWPAVTKQ